MNPFEAIVIICVVALIASVIKSKHQQTNSNEPEQPEQEQSLALEVQTLKKRVEALEAIVTDKGYDLKNEIDRL